MMIFGLVAAAFLLLGGCSEPKHQRLIPPKNFSMDKITTLLERMENSSRCGVCHVRKPFFHVEGKITGRLRKNATIYLYLLPRMDLHSAINITDHCIPVGKKPVEQMNTFRFGPIPAGTYLLYVPIHQFDEVQGFPYIKEFNESNHTAKTIFVGGDYRHSLGAFSIKPNEEGR